MARRAVDESVKLAVEESMKTPKIQALVREEIERAAQQSIRKYSIEYPQACGSPEIPTPPAKIAEEYLRNEAP